MVYHDDSDYTSRRIHALNALRSNLESRSFDTLKQDKDLVSLLLDDDDLLRIGKIRQVSNGYAHAYNLKAKFIGPLSDVAGHAYFIDFTPTNDTPALAKSREYKKNLEHIRRLVSTGRLKNFPGAPRGD